MREQIEKRLNRVIDQYRVRLLFAVESGSRAWGFASPDSDYDVRLVYSHPVEWYLSLADRSDTIETKDQDFDIDLSGWELRKALRQFAACSPTLNEWLLSPVVYRHDDRFIARMRELIPTYFNPKKAIFHYLSTAKGQAADHLRGDRVTIKKAFYILRPLAAGAWIRELGTMPPTDLATLLASVPCRDLHGLRSPIHDLIARKSTAAEKEPIVLAAPLVRYIEKAIPALEETAHKAEAAGARELGPLDEVFRGFLKA